MQERRSNSALGKWTQVIIWLQGGLGAAAFGVICWGAMHVLETTGKLAPLIQELEARRQARNAEMADLRQSDTETKVDLRDIHSQLNGQDRRLACLEIGGRCPERGAR